MHADVRQFIAKSKFHQAALRELAALLPAGDAELDELIAETVRDGDQIQFIFIVDAALAAGRNVQARHLARGAMLLPDFKHLGCVAWHVQGDDVPEQLLDAVANTLLKHDLKIAALLAAALWCQERRRGVFPPQLIPLARTLARSKGLEGAQLDLLQGLAVCTGDAALTAMIAEREGPRDATDVQLLTDGFVQSCRDPVFALVPARENKAFASGFTMRRAVPRIGRNDLCSCGSGKKYKHCCMEKDEKRLHRSSDVAGATFEELRAEPERYLTQTRLAKTPPHELARLDPTKVKPELLEEYLFRLGCFSLFDAVVEAFARLGCPDHLKETWNNVMYLVTRAGRKDIAQRLVEQRGSACNPEEDLAIATRLLLADHDPAAMVKLLEEGSLKALQTDDPDEFQSLAFGLLISRFRALGVFVARSMVPILPQKDASCLFEQLLKVRDKLNLSPEDPFGDVIDEWFRDAETDAGKDAAALQEARQRLDAKAQEVRQLKESLDSLHKELQGREQEPSAPAQASSSVAAPLDERALHEMRRKVEGLKSALKDRHNERNELRRQLQKAHADLETLRQNAAPPGAEDKERDGTDNEQELLLPEESAGTQPVRLIEFPRKFQDALASLPRSVARGTLTTLGRLAAGEPAAFVGAVRLKACPAILRQRIGIDFRLLFRLLPDRVQVVDLIPRQDLERKIKTLV